MTWREVKETPKTRRGSEGFNLPAWVQSQEPREEKRVRGVGLGTEIYPEVRERGPIQGSELERGLEV